MKSLKRDSRALSCSPQAPEIRFQSDEARQ
jgi:hypothetical protein